MNQKDVDSLRMQVRHLLNEGKHLRGNASFRQAGFFEGPHEVRIAWASRCKHLSTVLGPEGKTWKTELEKLNVKVQNLATLESFLGLLTGLEQAIEQGLLYTMRSLVRAELVGDLLAQANTLNDQGYALPAAVVGRAVLETQMRESCAAHQCPPPSLRPTMEHYVVELQRCGAISIAQAHRVRALAAVCNGAAHNLSTFDAREVPRTLADIQQLLSEL